MSIRQPWEQDPSEWKEESESFSTMPLENVSKLPGSSSVRNLLTINDVELPQLLADGKLTPHALVTFSRVEWDWHPEKKVYLPDRETLLVRAYLYDLTPYGKTHCLGVGRYEENVFRPYVGMQKQVDILVSREHGLVMLLRPEGKPHVFYHDIGTEKKGSTNGTFVDDETTLQNIVWPWEQKYCLSLGEGRHITEDGKQKYIGRFRLRYTLTGEDNAQRPG